MEEEIDEEDYDDLEEEDDYEDESKDSTLSDDWVEPDYLAQVF